MNIALDANEANIKERVGTGQYTGELLSHWVDSSQHDFSLLLKHPPLSTLPTANSHWKYHVLGPKPAWTMVALPLHLLTHRGYDVFFSPAHYLPPLTLTPSVVTVHDLAYEYFPELFLPKDLYKLQNWTKRAVKQATRVIAVSEATKADLVKLYGVSPAKVSVIYNGFNQELFQFPHKTSKEVLAKYKLPNTNYLLFLGTLQPRKNVIKLVQAFRLLKEAGYKGKLVLAGKIGWLAEETLAVIKSSPDAAEIVMTGYVDEETRAALYAHAEVFVLPSLYEGFGVPVLEAMASGCPVAAADNSSLPEVVGKAGLLFNASDPQDIADKVSQIRQNRAAWVKKGLAQAKKFSWDKCAKETIVILTQAAKKSQ